MTLGRLGNLELLAAIQAFGMRTDDLNGIFVYYRIKNKLS
jgi:hypothetical protein